MTDIDTQCYRCRMSTKIYIHRHQITGRDGYLNSQSIADIETPCDRQEVAGALLYAADHLENQRFPSLSNAEDMRDIVREVSPQEGIPN